MNVHAHRLSDEELASVLAGPRLLQHNMRPTEPIVMGDIVDIANDDGNLIPLDYDAI